MASCIFRQPFESKAARVRFRIPDKTFQRKRARTKSTSNVSTIVSPGHSKKLQALESLLLPWQSLPPYSGAGLLHSRNLVCSPPLQTWEHNVHSVQSDQSPSTEKTINKLTTVFHASVLLLMINCVITLSKWLWKPHDPQTSGSAVNFNNVMTQFIITAN